MERNQRSNDASPKNPKQNIRSNQKQNLPSLKSHSHTKDKFHEYHYSLVDGCDDRNQFEYNIIEPNNTIIRDKLSGRKFFNQTDRGGFERFSASRQYHKIDIYKRICNTNEKLAGFDTKHDTNKRSRMMKSLIVKKKVNTARETFEQGFRMYYSPSKTKKNYMSQTFYKPTTKQYNHDKL